MKNNTLIWSSIIVLVLSNAGNLLQYLSQLVLGRYLAPEAFGIYNSVNSLSVLVSSLTVALSFATAHELIMLGHDHAMHILFVRELFKTICVLCVLLTIMITLCSRMLANFLSLDSIIPILIYAFILWGILTQSLFMGVLQGLSRYTLLSFSQTLQMSARLIFIIIAVVLLNFSYNGALIGVLFSYFAVIAFYIYYLSDYFTLTPAQNLQLPKGWLRRMLAGSFHMALMWFYLGIISNVDIPLVRHYSSGYETGIYSAGAIIGRIVWFFPAMLVYVLFPEVVRSSADGQSSVLKALLIAGITFALSFGLAGIFYFYPEFILKTFLGSKYVESKQILIIVSFSMAILAMLSVLYNYNLAKKITSFLYPAYIILAACIVMIIIKFHSKPIEIANIFLVGLVLTAIINVGQFLVQFRREISYHVNNIKL
jgi:O-antigen/teichoic acid export membrane protein